MLKKTQEITDWLEIHRAEITLGASQFGKYINWRVDH
jgi:hypothetical protein